MRNLKKILALVLALVMSLSLMATASAADTTAASDASKYQTAIDVLQGVGVVKGDAGTNDVRPTASITRAEVAALLYRIATGDVTDAQASIHTGQGFTDVNAIDWYAGYVSYCYIAEIIKGNPNGTFEPNKEINGYATLAMILRAMGYGKNGEFVGDGWEIRTASTAKSIGILDGISDTQLSGPAARELVFEILFRAIFKDMVKFSALYPNNYESLNETLAKKSLGLEEIVGVVMANEYADLEGSTTLDAEETRFVTLDGEDTYTVTNQTTTLDDIGESRLVYIQNNRTVIKMLDSGLNGIGDTDMYAKDLNELKKAAGATGNGEHFINFDRVGVRISDYRIKYVLKANAAGTIDGLTPAVVAKRINDAAGDGRATTPTPATGTAATVEVVIAPKANITSVDLGYIRSIFSRADANGTSYDRGEVYVGSQSNTDISDVESDNFKYSYDRFLEEFTYASDSTTVTGNENGNYVKVIDNDGNGTVDYVLKTIYTFAQVSRVKDDKATLDVTNHTLTVKQDLSSGIDYTGNCRITTDAINNLTTQPVASDDALAVGDVVYYAIIDGVARATKVDPISVTIEKVDHNTWETTVSDGTVYPASGVHEHIEDEAYSSDKKDLAGKVSYDIYLDRAGNLGVFVKSDSVGEFKLLTDGWYHRLIDSKEYAVKAYNNETKAQDTVMVTTNASLFVNDETSGNDWLRLKWFGGNTDGKVTNASALNGDGTVVHTTVAAIAEDGTILPVENSSVTGRYQHSILDLYAADINDGKAVVPTAAAVKGTVYSTTNGANTAYNTLGDQGDVKPSNFFDVGYNPNNPNWTYDVRALTSTDYYVVYPVGNGNVEVIHTVGYPNAPDLSKLEVEDIYAVGTYREAENNLNAQNYYIANVVVVELKSAPSGTGELVLVVDDTSRYTDVRYRDVKIINSKGEVENVKVDWTGSITNTLSYVDGKDQGKQVTPGFYYLFGDKETGCRLTSDKTGKTNVRTPLNAIELRGTGKVTAAYVEKAEYTALEQYILTQDWVKDGSTPEKKSGTSYYTLGADTPLYTLTYNYNTYPDSNPNLEPVSPDTKDNGVLGGRVDVTLDGTWSRDTNDSPRPVDQNVTYYNYNRVLVVHNDKNAVTYLVSLDNIYDQQHVPTPYVPDYAQTLWNNCIPAKAADSVYAAPTYTFYGNDEPADTIEYADAINEVVTSKEDWNIVVTGSGITRVTVSAKKGTDDAVVTDVTKTTVAGETQYVYPVVPEHDADVVYTVTALFKNASDKDDVAVWTLTQKAQTEPGRQLVADANTSGIQVVSSNVGTTTGAATINVESAAGTFLSTLESVLKTVDGETVEITVIDTNNQAESEDWLKNHTVADVVGTGMTLKATVTKANGDEVEIDLAVQDNTAAGGTVTAPVETETDEATGKTTSVVTPDDQKITEAAENGNTSVTIPVTNDNDTDKSKVSLTPEAVTALQDNGMNVVMESSKGNVTVPSGALGAALGGGADGTESVDIVIESVDPADVTGAPTDALVVDVTIYVDDVATPLNGLDASSKITISLPAPEGAAESVKVCYIDTNNDLVEVNGGAPVAIEDGFVTFVVDHLTTFVLSEEAAVADARTFAKAALDAYVSWAKKNVDLTSEWFGQNGEIGAAEGANYTNSNDNDTWCNGMLEDNGLIAMNLSEGIAAIKAMIDDAATVSAVQGIFWASNKDAEGNPTGGFTCWSFDSSDNGGFGYTGNLKDYIAEQVQLMLVKAAILSSHSGTDFSSVTAEAVATAAAEQPGYDASNRATHCMAAAIRLLYACVEGDAGAADVSETN